MDGAHLKEMPVWAEDSNGSIVARHLLGLLLDDVQSAASRIVFFVAYSGTGKCERTTKAKTRLKKTRYLRHPLQETSDE